MKYWMLLAGLLLGLSLNGLAQADAEPFPPELQAGSVTLVLNGVGTRKKLFVPVYKAGLYLRQKSNDPHAILTAEEPMAMRIVITSSLVTPEKMARATREGFQKSTGGDTAAIAPQIEQMIRFFEAALEEGDVFDLLYQPGVGTRFIRNNVEKDVAPGAEFKKALFGIWLSGDPVQKNLKKALLGQ